jgi:hypothetical protein
MITNCSFSKFNDLLGIQEVISSSLVSGLGEAKHLPDVIQDVKNNYLAHYYGEDLSGLGDTAEDKLEALSEVGEAMKLVFDTLNNDKPQIGTDNTRMQSKYEQLGLFNGNQDAFFKDFERQTDDIVSMWASSYTKTNSIHAADEGNIHPTLSLTTGEQIDVTYNVAGAELAKLDIPVTNERLNLDKQITDHNDLTYHYFKGAVSANTKFVQEFNSSLVNRAIITMDPTTGRNSKVITSNADLDQAIKSWKSELFSSLYPDKGDLYSPVGDDKILRSDLPELLDQVKSEFKADEIEVKDLLQWLQSRSPKLTRYYNYLTLSNFDKMLDIFGKGLVEVKSNLVGLNNESYNTTKYYLTGSNALSKNWSDNELINAFTEHSALYKILIENTNQFSPEDGLKTDRFLKSDQVAFSMNKLRTFIDREDTTGSMKQALENALLYKFKPSIVNIDFKNEFVNKKPTLADNTVYLSLYTKYFKDADTINGKPNPILTSLGKVGRSIMNQDITSYRQVFGDFSREGNFDLDIFKVIPATIAKTVSKNYNEISWSAKEKAYDATMLNTKLSDKQGAIFRSKLNAQGNTISEDLFNKFKQDFGVDVKDSKVYYSITGKRFYYDVFGEAFFNESGTRFNMRNIKSPDSFFSMMGEDGQTLDPVFKDYSNLVDVAAYSLNEPLKGMDFATLFQFKTALDSDGNNAHLDALLKIASNIIYTRDVKLNYLGSTNDLNEIRGAVSNVPKLVDNFNRKMENVLDSKSKMLNVAFTPKVQSAVKSYTDLLGTIRGRDTKAVTINAEGSAVPTYGIINLMNDTHNLYSHIRKSPTFDNSPLSNNLFINNPGVIKDIVIRSIADIQTAGRRKSSGKMTPTETSTYDIVYDYLRNKSATAIADRSPIFQPTVFADKSQHSGVQIDPMSRIKIGNRQFSSKQYHEYNAEDFQKLHFTTQNGYYSKLESNLLDTYNNVFKGTIKPVALSYLEDTRILSKILNDTKFDNKLNIQDQITERTLKYNRDYYKGDLLSKEIDNYNRLVRTQKSGVSSLAEANSVLGILNEKGFLRSAQSNLNINSIVKELVYSKDKKSGSIGVSNTIRKYIEDYSTPENHEAMMKKAQAKFAANLDKMGFEIQSHDINDKENPIVKRGLAYFRINDSNEFYNKNTKTLANHTGEATSDGTYSSDFKLNPILEQYFWETNAINENFQDSTVGTIHGHPAKGLVDSTESEEAAKLVAMYKRMVAHQATIHPYTLNLINGVPFYNRVAYVVDPSKSLFNQIGETQNQDVTDGSTYTLMLHRFLENNSLLDQRGAVHHKSFGTTVNRFFNAAGLMKHAAHGMTNERLRLSDSAENSYKNIVKRMIDESFNIKGVPVHHDLSRDYNGNQILIDKVTKGNGAYYLTRDNDLMQVTGFRAVDFKRGLYEVTESNQSANTHSTKTVTLNSLHDIWHKVFGGGTDTTTDTEGNIISQGQIGTPERSVHRSDEDRNSTLANGNANKGFVFGDDSWEHLAYFVNNVGYKVNHAGLDSVALQMNLPYEQLRDVINERTGSNDYTEHGDSEYPEQTSVWQPLKSHYISQITFDSGQKVGVQNINPSSILNRNSSDKFWESDFVSNLHTGIQLDYEHETDDSEVSEMTQIIGALGFNGDTPRYSENVYKAIGKYIDVNMSDILPFISATDPESRANFYNYIAKEVVKNFQTKDTMSLSNAIMYKIQDELGRQKDILTELGVQEPNSTENKLALAKLEDFERESFKIPFSDSNVFGSFVTTVNNLFTRKGIRRKLSGIAAIISPHSSFIEVKDVPQFDPTGKQVGTTTVTDEGYYKWKKDVMSKDWFQQVSQAAGGDELGILSLHHKPAKASDVSLLDTVIHNGTTLRLDTNAKYRNFKNTVSPNDDVVIHNGANRDLRATDFRWSLGTDANKYSIYDLPNSQLAFVMRELQGASKDVAKYKNEVAFSGMSKFEKEEATNDVTAKVAKYQSLISEYNNLLPHTDGFLPEIKGEVSTRVVTNRAIKINNQVELPDFDENTFKYIKNRILNDYKTVYEQKKVPFTTENAQLLANQPEEFIRRYGQQGNDLLDGLSSYAATAGLDKVSALKGWLRAEAPKLQMSGEYTITPGEIALPKIYKSKFGLSQDDMISDISSEFFINRLNANAAPQPGIPHDFYIRESNGNHVYIYLDGSQNHNRIKSVLDNMEVDSRQIYNIHGNAKTYRVDGNGNVMYEIGNAQFNRFTQAGSIHEAIVVKDFNDLVALQNMTTYKSSTLEDLVTNFGAGIEVAKLGLIYQKHLAANPKVSEAIDRRIATLNSLTTKQDTIAEKSEAIQQQIKDLANYKSDDLLVNYNEEWTRDQLDSIQNRIQNSTNSDEIQRANTKYKVYNSYLDALTAFRKVDPNAEPTEDERAINYIKNGLIVPLQFKERDPSARVDVDMSSADKRKALADIAKGNYESAPAKRLIEKVKGFEANDSYPIIEGLGGKSERRMAIGSDEMKSTYEGIKPEVDTNPSDLLKEGLLKEAQSIHDNLLRSINYKNDKLQSTSKETEVTDFLERLHQYQLAKSASTNERLGRERYNSFLLSLENTVARIPGQGMQSFMPMKIAFFLDTEANTALVNPYNLWLTGGDFDIDKIFAVGYSFDNRGKLISWHPEFNYQSANKLRKSLELPIADEAKRTLSMTPTPNTILLGVHDLETVNNYYANKKNVSDELFGHYVDVMNKLGSGYDYHVVGLGEEHSDLLTQFEKNVNGDEDQTGYFNQIANKRHESEATLNIIAANMYQHSIDPRNAPHAFAPVDMNDPAKAADMSTKGEEIRRITHHDPTAIPILKEGNMIGKDVIGISASSGLKAFSAITSTYMRATKGDFDNLPFFQRIKQFIIDKNGDTQTLPDDRIATIVGGLNFNGKEQYLKAYLDKSVTGVLSLEEAAKYIDAMIEGQKTKGDVALVLSALLSAATDNAKELILGKINAGPETAGMYIRALMLGSDFSSYANMMISKEAELIIKYSKQNIFDEATKDRNLKGAVNIIRAKVIPIEHYLTSDAINIAAKALLDNELIAPKADGKRKPYAAELVREAISTSDPEDLKWMMGVVKDGVPVNNDPRFQLGTKPRGVSARSGDDDDNENDLAELYDTEWQGEDSESNDDDYWYEMGSEQQEDPSGGYFKSNVVKASLAFNRLIADNIKLKNDMNFAVNFDVVNQFDHDMKATEAITVLASQLGINTGIRSDDYGVYNFFNKLETHVNGLLSKQFANAADESESFTAFSNNYGSDIVANGFNAKKFSIDADYSKRAIDMYDRLKTDVNILKVLKSVEHFDKMYQLGVRADTAVKNSSIKARMTDYLIGELSNRQVLPDMSFSPTEDPNRVVSYRGNISQDDYKRISNFIDDVLTSNFLGSLNKDPHRPSSLSPIRVNDGDITVNDNYTTVINHTPFEVNLGNNLGRTQFTTWFENTVLGDLKLGHLRDSYGNLIEGPANVELTNNYFLNQFNIEKGMDPVSKTPFIYYKLPVNMTQILSEDDKQMFDNLSSSFYTLKKYSYGGNNLVDLLYLYNLIVHRNKVTGASLNKLFNGVADLNNSSIIQDHLKFIGDLDRKVDVLKAGQYFQLQDVVQKGLAKEVSELPKPSPGVTLPSIVKIKSFSNGVMKDNFHVLNGSVYDPITISETALDKNIRINNGSRNLSSMISDGSVVSAKARIDKLFGEGNISVKRLDETCE